MKKLILPIMICLFMVSSVFASMGDFNDLLNEQTRQTGSWWDNVKLSFTKQSIAGDLYCCESCQPSSTGSIPYTALTPSTINCGTQRAYVDIFGKNANGGKTPLIEKETLDGTTTYTCSGYSLGCSYDCYICNKAGPGGSAGLDTCYTTQECINKATSMQLPNANSYECSNGACRQNCDASWTNQYCDGNYVMRSGTRASQCADPNPVDTVADCSSVGKTCEGGACVDAQTTTTKACYKCNGNALENQEVTTDTCPAGYVETAPASCGTAQTLTCYKCVAGVQKSASFTSCPSDYFTTPQTCSSVANGTCSTPGFIGKPVFTPGRISSGVAATVTITQQFCASDAGVYSLEAGTEWFSAYIPALQSLISIDHNTCDPSETWYSNQNVTLTKGLNTITFKVTPGVKGEIGKRGEYAVHTAWFKQCGRVLGESNLNQPISIAATKLYVGEVSGSVKCGEECTVSNKKSEENSLCDTGWCYYNAGGILSSSYSSCQQKTLTSGTLTENQMKTIKGGVCLTIEQPKISKGVFIEDIETLSATTLAESFCGSGGSFGTYGCEDGASCNSFKYLMDNNDIQETLVKTVFYNIDGNTVQILSKDNSNNYGICIKKSESNTCSMFPIDWPLKGQQCGNGAIIIIGIMAVFLLIASMGKTKGSDKK